VEKGADDSERTSNGQTALHRAAENGHGAVVLLLLERGAVVLLLLERRADIDAKRFNGLDGGALGGLERAQGSGAVVAGARGRRRRVG